MVTMGHLRGWQLQVPCRGIGRHRFCKGFSHTSQRRRPMPEGSTPKQKRQYEHIKESYQDKGVGAKEAKERAARTVSKQRGKSKSKS
jgi:hypothetical protein